MSGQEDVLSAAKRLIKSRMQQAICREKVKEAGEEDQIWGPMLNLANSFAEEASKDWQNYRKHHPFMVFTIMDAARQAQHSAGVPYREQCSEAWLKKVIASYLETFDPIELTTPMGDA